MSFGFDWYLLSGVPHWYSSSLQHSTGCVVVPMSSLDIQNRKLHRNVARPEVSLLPEGGATDLSEDSGSGGPIRLFFTSLHQREAATQNLHHHQSL